MPPTGRGGAGNIEKANRRISQDLEATHTDGATEALSTLQGEKPAAHLGRGGAGNVYSPAKLAETGTFAVREAEPSPLLSTSPIKTTRTDDSARDLNSETFKSQGRGGSGNFITLQSSKIREAAQRTEEMREKVMQDVNTGLEKPEKAYLREPLQKTLDEQNTL